MLKILIDSAIEAALRQEWQKAIDINLKILEQSPYHSPTLNRLAKAYQHCGQIDNAIKTYEQALEFNRFNDIARKNLLKLKKQTGQADQAMVIGSIIDCDFVEEPGKPKLCLC
jgi:tetratricopeptide (TPR) repeat protein